MIIILVIIKNIIITITSLCWDFFYKCLLLTFCYNQSNIHCFWDNKQFVK